MTHLTTRMPGKKLLVADDSLTIQKVIRLALSNEGYEIQAISDGGEAIQQISTFRPDAVLVDVSLPTRSAFEIKREVNGMPDHAATRFVLMSSAFEKIDEAQVDEVGFDGRLTKPFDPAHLRQVLSDVLAAPVHKPAAANIPPPAPPPEDLERPEPSSVSIGIQLDPPTDLPPSDFEPFEPPRTHAPLTPDLPPPFTSAEPAAPAGMPELEDDLWGKHEEAPVSAQPRTRTAAPADRPVDRQADRDEIRELTESTIRMSGLAELPQTDASEFSWEVNEPSLKPPSSLADTGDSPFQIAPPAFPEVHSGERDFPPVAPPAQQQPSSPRNASPAPVSAAGIALPNMEEAVRRQVQETLEKMAREILPEVAERVIKAEISRLLNEKF